MNRKSWIFTSLEFLLFCFPSLLSKNVYFYVYFHVAKFSSASGCQKIPDLCNLNDILLTHKEFAPFIALPLLSPLIDVWH